MSDLYNTLSYIIKKIYVYVKRNVYMNVKYTSNAIQNVCEMWNLHTLELFYHTQIVQFI